jgi:hypothetical protein
VLRIFIALKNPSPSPGSNPQPLGPVARILTTIPQTRLVQLQLIGTIFPIYYSCLAPLLVGAPGRCPTDSSLNPALVLLKNRH